MALTISSVIHRQVLDWVCDSKFSGLMIDEFTDINIINLLMVFATYLEEGLYVTRFLGLRWLLNDKKDSKMIFEVLMGLVKT